MLCVCVIVHLWCVRAADHHLYCASNQLDVLPPRKNTMSCFQSYEKQKEEERGRAAGIQRPHYDHYKVESDGFIFFSDPYPQSCHVGL